MAPRGRARIIRRPGPAPRARRPGFLRLPNPSFNIAPLNSVGRGNCVVELLAAGAGNGRVRLLLCPNPPLSRRGRRLLIGLLAAFMGLYALLLASRGLWLVLPFAGLELAAMAAALHVTAHRARVSETVEIDARELRIRRGNPDRSDSVAFASGWARVRLLAGAARWHPPRLLVGAHGRWVEVGRFLTDEERRRAARLIEKALAPHSAW